MFSRRLILNIKEDSIITLLFSTVTHKLHIIKCNKITYNIYYNNV